MAGNSGIEAILEKKAQKQAEKAQRSDAGKVNRIAIEQDEFGFYSARYTEGGLVPEVLRNKFTRKHLVLDLIKNHYGNLDLVI